MSVPAQSVSVIVTTYNRPAALRCVLEGLLRQSASPGEVVIADDGSDSVTAELIAQYAQDASVKLMHVWQEDQGFRAASARNRAVAKSSGHYLVFLDGDSIPCRDFVRRHSTLAEAGWFVVGNRVLLDPRLTADVESGRIRPCDIPLYTWPAYRVTGKVNRLLPLLSLGEGRWRKRRPHEWRGARTCNLGAWRSDFATVNGFDERYEGWGHEDADLVARLLALGVRRKDGHFAAPVLHLWHSENDRSAEKANAERLRQVLEGADREYVAARGLSQYLPRS